MELSLKKIVQLFFRTKRVCRFFGLCLQEQILLKKEEVNIALMTGSYKGCVESFLKSKVYYSIRP